MANSAVVGTLRAILSLDSAEFDAGMKRVSSSAKAWSVDLGRMGQQATALGKSMTTMLTVPIVAAFGSATKAAMDFESSFAGVRKTVDASEAEFKVMEQQFRDLAKTIPINVNELNRLGEAAGALGIPKAEVVDFARVMALLGETTNLTSDQAAESIAKIQNIFNAAGKDTENFASTLVALGNAGASTESQIVEMATRIAGAGNAINMTQGEVLAFASALSSVGIEAEMGGSAISRVFIDMASAVSEGGQAVEGFAHVAGMSIQQFSKLFREDAAGAAQAFIQGLSQIKQSGGDLLGTLEELGFKEIRVRDTLLRTAGAGDLLTNALKLQKTAWQENSALTAEAAKRFETTESQLALLWNRVKDVGITLGNALLPAIKSVTQFLGSLLPIIEGVANVFGSLPGPIQAITLGFVALVAAAGPALMLFGQIAIGASALATTFTAQGIAAKALTGQYALLNSALVLLGQTAAVVGVAFVGWQLGKFIGEVTGATGVVQNLTEKVMGYRDASVPLEAQQRLINEAIKQGAAQGISFADAMAFLQKKGDALRASHAETAKATQNVATTTDKAAKSSREFTKSTDDQKTAQKAAKEAAEAQEKALQNLERATKALGVTTQQDLNESLHDLYLGFNGALAGGVALNKALPPLIDKLQDIIVKAKASGLNVKYLEEQLDQLRQTLNQIDPKKGLPFTEIDVRKLGTEVKLLSLETIKAKRSADDLEGAYEKLGIETSADLHKAADEARKAYAIIAASGKATATELEQARQRVLEAEIAAGERTVSIWETQIRPAIQRVIDDISYAMARGLTDMLTGVSSFADGWKSIWESIKNIARQILDDLLAYFIRDFIGGMIKGLISSQLGKLFGSLFGGGGGGGGGITPFLPGSFSPGGISPGVGGLPGGAAIGQVGTTIGILDGLVNWLSPDGTGLVEGIIDVWKDPHTPERTDAEFLQEMIDYQGFDYSGVQDFLRQHPELWGQFGMPSFRNGTNGFVDFGTGTLAMLHGREAVVPESAATDGLLGSGTVTIVFEQDGRKSAQYIAPFIVDEVFRLRQA